MEPGQLIKRLNNYIIVYHNTVDFAKNKLNRTEHNSYLRGRK